MKLIKVVPRIVQHLLQRSSYNGLREIVQVQDLSPFLMNNNVQVSELIAVDGNSKQRDSKVLCLHDRVVASVGDEQLGLVVGQDISLGPPNEGCD